MEPIGLIVLIVIGVMTLLAAVMPNGLALLAQFFSNILAVVAGIGIFVFLYVTFGKKGD